MRITVSSLLPYQPPKSALPAPYTKMHTKVHLDDLFVSKCSSFHLFFFQKHFYQIICLLKNVYYLSIDNW